MNEAQKATLAALPGWEIQSAQGGPYSQMAYILPDGQAFGVSESSTTEVVTYPKGTVIIGTPA